MRKLLLSLAAVAVFAIASLVTININEVEKTASTPEHMDFEEWALLASTPETMDFEEWAL